MGINGEDPLQLWTFQTQDFSLTEGCVDHSKSEYHRMVQGVPLAYQKLADLLGTDQIVWCYTDRTDYKKTGVSRTEWVLEVPESEILKFIDGFVWNRILGQKCPPPKELLYSWRVPAIERHPGDFPAQERFIADQNKSYWELPPPSGDWWNHLFVENSENEGIDALIRHPIRREWVKDQKKG